MENRMQQLQNLLMNLPAHTINTILAQDKYQVRSGAGCSQSNEGESNERSGCDRPTDCQSLHITTPGLDGSPITIQIERSQVSSYIQLTHQKTTLHSRTSDTNGITSVISAILNDPTPARRAPEVECWSVSNGVTTKLSPAEFGMQVARQYPGIEMPCLLHYFEKPLPPSGFIIKDGETQPFQAGPAAIDTERDKQITVYVMKFLQQANQHTPELPQLICDLKPLLDNLDLAEMKPISKLIPTDLNTWAIFNACEPKLKLLQTALAQQRAPIAGSLGEENTQKLATFLKHQYPALAKYHSLLHTDNKGPYRVMCRYPETAKQIFAQAWTFLSDRQSHTEFFEQHGSVLKALCQSPQFCEKLGLEQSHIKQVNSGFDALASEAPAVAAKPVGPRI